MSTMTATLASETTRRTRYTPPGNQQQIKLSGALSLRPTRRQAIGQTVDMFSGAVQKKAGHHLLREDEVLYFAGDIAVLSKPCVSIVGTREATEEGAGRARRLAKFLARNDIVVVSGLALGIDTHAHSACLEAGGRTMAVLGTPLEKCSPMQNARLQERIYTDHLLITQFSPGAAVFPANFPTRNKLMATLSDATVIIEASDSSGTLHQAAECQRLGRHLVILKSVVDTPSLTWPKKFVKQPNVHVLEQPEDILRVLGLS